MAGLSSQNYAPLAVEGVRFLMLHAKNAVVPAMYMWTDLLPCISRRALKTMNVFALKDWVTPAVITERTEI
jgi:hypothetical protein